MRGSLPASVGAAMDNKHTPSRDEATSGRSDAAVGMDQGLRVLSYLISGVLVYGLLGWVGDHFLGTAFLLPIGIVGGAAFGVYVVIRRFGQLSDPVGTTVTGKQQKATTTEGDQ